MNKIVVEPRQPAGFRDYLPDTMIPRQKMIDTIIRVYQQFGFDPLQTPVVEMLEVLTGGDPAFRKQIFLTTVATGDEEALAETAEEMEENISEGTMALRFDLTVALARVVAANAELPMPFNRYQIGDVFRGEKPQAGRFRGFAQCDIDTVGSASLLSDTQIIQVMFACMRALNVWKFQIRVNNRKVLNGLAETIGIISSPERVASVLRILDKLDKISWEEAVAELERQPDNCFDTGAPALTGDQISTIEQFIGISGATDAIISQLFTLFPKKGIGYDGTAELAGIFERLGGLMLPEESVRLDLSIARGLGYYTGPVFETTLTDLPGYGSVFSGGRYDDLVTRFDPSRRVPAVGASIGIDRLFAALTELQKVRTQKTLVEVFIASLDSEFDIDRLKLAESLRQEGINTQVYVGEERLKKQLKLAGRQEIPVTILIGPEEQDKGEVIVRNMRTSTQKSVPIGNACQTVRDLLNS